MRPRGMGSGTGRGWWSIPGLRAAAVLLVALAAWGCQDDFFFEPAAPNAGVAVSLSVDQAALAGTPLDDFEDANRARITLRLAGQVAHQEEVGLQSSTVGKRAVVRVGIEEETQFEVEAALMIDDQVVFVGTGSVLVTPGETASTDVALTHTGGADADETTGMYVLTSINGQPLPFTTPDDAGPGCDSRILTMSIGLRGDGFWIYFIVEEEVATTADPEFCGGLHIESGGDAFSLSGESLSLSDEDGTIAATLSGGVMTATITEDGESFEFRLQRVPPPTGLDGAYTLTSVNGQSLPALLPDEAGPGCDVRILSGGLVLRSDGTAALSVAGEDVRRTSDETCDEVFDETSESTWAGDDTEFGFMPFLELDIGVLTIGTVSDGDVVLTLEDPKSPSTLRLRFTPS